MGQPGAEPEREAGDENLEPMLQEISSLAVWNYAAIVKLKGFERSVAARLSSSLLFRSGRFHLVEGPREEVRLDLASVLKLWTPHPEDMDYIDHPITADLAVAYADFDQLCAYNQKLREVAKSVAEDEQHPGARAAASRVLRQAKANLEGVRLELGAIEAIAEEQSEAPTTHLAELAEHVRSLNCSLDAMKDLPHVHFFDDALRFDRAERIPILTVAYTDSRRAVAMDHAERAGHFTLDRASRRFKQLVVATGRRPLCMVEERSDKSADLSEWLEQRCSVM